MDEKVYMTEEEFLRFRRSILIAVWIMVPFWIFTSLACLSVLVILEVL